MDSPTPSRPTTRLDVTAARQSVDLVLIGDESATLERWNAALSEHLDSDYTDSISSVHRAGRLLAALNNVSSPSVVLDVSSHVVDDKLIGVLSKNLAENAYLVVLADEDDEAAVEELRARLPIDDVRSRKATTIRARSLVDTAREMTFMRNRLGRRSARPGAEERLRRLNQIGLAFSRERSLSKLLNLVLRECMNQLNADAGSIYILEAPGGRRKTSNRLLGRAKRQSSASALRITRDMVEAAGWKLRFAAAQNDSVEIPFREFTFPANEESIAGFAAIHGEVVNIRDAYDIPVDKPYNFNRMIDEQYSYRCVSILTIPMRNMNDEVIGVVQVINRKHDPLKKLTDPKKASRYVAPFDSDDIMLANMLATHAGAAIETVRLNDSITNLFESFVYASVRAIEQRDPSTAGHSARVDRITLGIADLINRTETGPFANIAFTDEEMVELHYAALLHDVGKIGVREHILTKANKLFPNQRNMLCVRAELIAAGIREASLLQRTQMQLEAADVAALEAAETATQAALKQIEEDITFILDINSPGYMDDTKRARLEEVYARRYPVVSSVRDSLLDEEEYYSLKTVRGSLNPEEREEIQSHVAKSRVFLDQIPWTAELANVPIIAGQHHEKMNGQGYPDAIPAIETPLQARIMAVADVFDSLTSGDRPYKPAIPLERAVQILESMRDGGELDPDVVNLFIENEVWEKLNLRVIHLADATPEQRAAT